MTQEICPRGHSLKGNFCTVCGYRWPGEPLIIIHWGGKMFTFRNAAEALEAGFHLK